MNARLHKACLSPYKTLFSPDSCGGHLCEFWNLPSGWQPGCLDSAAGWRLDHIGKPLAKRSGAILNYHSNAYLSRPHLSRNVRNTTIRARVASHSMGPKKLHMRHSGNSLSSSSHRVERERVRPLACKSRQLSKVTSCEPNLLLH